MRWPRLSKSQSQILSTLFKASLSSPYQGLGATAAAAAATAAGERPSFRCVLICWSYSFVYETACLLFSAADATKMARIAV